MEAIWGIDLGGTKIEGVVLPADWQRNLQQLQPLARLRIDTEADKGYMHILHQIQKLLQMLEQETGLKPARLGIGTPGTRDPVTGLMKNSNTVCLNGQPLKKDLEALLRIPVIMANDANCFALAESRLGRVALEQLHPEVVFGVIMGTGVGGGLVVRNQLIQGAQGIAGEWGHNFLDASGGPCYCGKTGCVETVISGPALERYYASLTGQHIKLKTIVQRFQEGDAAASQTIERLLENFGKAISVVINIVDPDVVVLGGGLANIDLLYSEGLQRIRKYVFNNRLDTRIYPPALGDSAGVFGAAMLVSA
ncbi:MAG: ROK family protein [Thermoflavifilum sp.]|uniref:ROK family protein n=1 Tax=Thermoflavifilum sp. TaxID=1968839 RepID=UPI0018A5095B|nr:ROK family protein [Thermoflavifilum sp.]QOR75726.1 MAG: ROK family protein [Thermoflavifilum sp.]